VDLDVHLPLVSAGDPEAFASWVAGAEPSLRASLASFASVVDTEAVLQEALLRVWQVAPRCVPDGKPNALFRLAFRITRNLALSEARRARALVEPSEERFGESDPRPVDPMLRRALLECHEHLPKQPRLVFDARIASAPEPDVEIAARLGMKLNTFLQNFGRARKLLAECLDKKGIALAEIAP
jgi:RNA polymerase sigma-70 factor (ECF subfamily)